MDQLVSAVEMVEDGAAPRGQRPTLPALMPHVGDAATWTGAAPPAPAHPALPLHSPFIADSRPNATAPARGQRVHSGEPRMAVLVARAAAPPSIDEQAHEHQRLLNDYSSSLAKTKAARKLLNRQGWIANWCPEGKRAFFIYAYEVAMVGAGSVAGCMTSVWGGDAVRLEMNAKVLALKLRQMFGRRVVKANHAFIATLSRPCLVHCSAGNTAGSGAILQRQAGDAITASVACGTVVCFSGGPGKRHLEARVCQVNVHSRYCPGAPGNGSAEDAYVEYWKARMRGASGGCSASVLRMPQIVRSRDINFAAGRKQTQPAKTKCYSFLGSAKRAKVGGRARGCCGAGTAGSPGTKTLKLEDDAPPDTARAAAAVTATESRRRTGARTVQIGGTQPAPAPDHAAAQFASSGVEMAGGFAAAPDSDPVPHGNLVAPTGGPGAPPSPFLQARAPRPVNPSSWTAANGYGRRPFPAGTAPG